MEKPEEHWTPLNWGQCMTCHISVRRFNAALHNPQGHSHHKLYVSETVHSLCWWRSLSDIYWCEQRRFLIHKMSIAHIIKNGRGLVGQTYELCVPVRRGLVLFQPPRWRCPEAYRGQVLLTGRDGIVLWIDTWSVNDIHNLNLMAEMYDAEGK